MNKDMQKFLDKAEVLIEALPYIQRFNRRIIVVKYGGSAMVDEELKSQVIKDVTLLKLVGFKPIIVHGGGKEISRWVGKVGMEPEFVNGLRVTDEATMELAEMVLGRVNKSLVQLVESLGVRAIGISGKDGKLLSVNKKYAGGEDIGFVGEIKDVNATVLYDLLEKDFLPIVCPVGLDDNYNTYNINADDAACAIARAMRAEKLAFLTDIEGVYKNPGAPETLISELTVTEARNLMREGYIGGGMLPKLHNCIDADLYLDRHPRKGAGSPDRDRRKNSNSGRYGKGLRHDSSEYVHYACIYYDGCGNWKGDSSEGFKRRCGRYI